MGQLRSDGQSWLSVRAAVVSGYFACRVAFAAARAQTWSGSSSFGLEAGQIWSKTPDLVWEQLLGHASFGLGAVGNQTRIGPQIGLGADWSGS